MDGSRTKKAEVIEYVLKNCKVEDRQSVLMVGDTTHDLQMAVNAGCTSVGVSYGAHDSAIFAPLNPLFVAHSVPELHRFLLTTVSSPSSPAP